MEKDCLKRVSICTNKQFFLILNYNFVVYPCYITFVNNYNEELYISPYGAYQDSLGVHDIIIIIMLSVYVKPLGQ